MAKPTILLADNDQVSLKILRAFFRKNGFSILAAKDIATAKEALQESKYDVAVLDIRLRKDGDEKDISGLVLAKTVSPDLPKIIYTKFPTYKYVREAFVVDAKGIPPAIDFVAKQEGLPLLLSAVRNALKIAKNRKFLVSLQNGDNRAWASLWDKEAWRIIALGRHYGLNDEDAMKMCVDTFRELAEDTAPEKKRSVLKQTSLRAILTDKALHKVKDFESRPTKPRPVRSKGSDEDKVSLIDQGLLADIAAPAIAKRVSRSKLVDQLSRAIHELSPRQQQVITLRLFQGIPARDIAKQLKVTERTTRNHLDVALKHLRNKIAELEED